MAMNDTVHDMRFSIDQLLRIRVAWKAEGDICHLLASILPTFRRSEEKAAFDAAIVLSNDVHNGRILGFEVKTLVASAQAARKDAGPQWKSAIVGQRSQCSSDIFCIVFPLLRNQNYVALRSGISSATFVDEEHGVVWYKRYQNAEIGHQITHSVPPSLWPRVISLPDMKDVLESIRDSVLAAPSDNINLSKKDFRIKIQ